MRTAPFGREFEAVLEKLDLVENRSNGSLLFVREQHSMEQVGPASVFALEVAAKYDADAVYFRKFGDNRTPLAQIYLYDNTGGKHDIHECADIQRKLWSSGVVPLFIIIGRTSVDIFDSRKPVTPFLNGTILPNPIETLQTSNKALKEYSAKLFDNGSFWEQERYSNNFLNSTSAYADLISGLKKIRRAFLSQSDLPEKTSHKLLVQSILIKYLEERGEEGEALFAKNFFEQFGADNFCGVLRKRGQIIKLFAALSSHFSGHIFTWEDPEEIAQLRRSNLSVLANFLDANIAGEQFVLWRQYSFQHLPVELISSIYEEFLSEGKSDVVYTPHFLVNALVDEAMPLDKPKTDFKLVDGSCGSGIFLVAAYKRLLEWWRYSEYQKSRTLPSYPPLRTLKTLLRKSIFGVDVEEDATRLTVFSLCLALCDVLTPKQIWTELKFDDLSLENVVNKDFFEFIGDTAKAFDLVIGNPPFVEYNSAPFQELITRHQLTPSAKIPQNQIALLFLDQAMGILKKNGNLCLIMPSGPLLYNDTLEFREAFFSAYNVTQIFDFTNLSATLFGKANVATCAVFVQNNTAQGNIVHIIARRTKSSKERLFFEIDHYDFHVVSYDDAVSERLVWKANLYGGRRVLALVKRFSGTRVRTLLTFLKGKRVKEGWDFGQGYIVGIKNSKHEAPYITGQLTIVSEQFTEDGIGATQVQEAMLFKDKSREALFQPPHLIIKKNIGRRSLPIVLSNKYLTFTDNTMGIHAPKSAIKELRALEHFLKANSDTLRFLISTRSARSGISRSTYTLLQEDITGLPYPEDEREMKLSATEKIIRNDVLNYYLEQLSAGENAAVNYPVTGRQLLGFADTFCKALNALYETGSKKFQLQSIANADAFLILSFAYTNRELEPTFLDNSKRHEANIKELVQTQTGKSLYINRVVHLYERDRIYLVKPKQLRYWLKSIALRDADETVTDLINSGY